MGTTIILVILGITVVSLLVLFFRRIVIQKRGGKGTKLLKSFFLDYGEVKWKVNYKVEYDNSEETLIETVPYCKNCKLKYHCDLNEMKQSIQLKCLCCRDIKINYPLSDNYRNVQNIAEAEIRKIRKYILSK